MRKRLNSIFDIAGYDENAITKSFGVILRKDKTLLNYFLTAAFKKKYRLTKAQFDKTQFHFEKKHSGGRTDIEIKNDNMHLIIESKIGPNSVKLNQAIKYSELLQKSNANDKCFVFLTEIGNLEIDKNLKTQFPKIIYTNLSWEFTLEIIQRRKNIQVDLAIEYQNYILEGRKMKIHDIDIWAVVVKGEQKINYDENNYYINNKRHSPILIGKREWDKELRKAVVKELRPVIKIHDSDSEKGKNNGGNYIYDLGKKIELKKPIINKFYQTSAISLSFNDIDL